MNIVHIASEYAPIAKAGGLGDVVSGMSKSTRNKGHHPIAVIPLYTHIDKTSLCKESETDKYTLWSTIDSGVKVLLLSPHMQTYTEIYGDKKQDCSKFALFTEHAIEIISLMPHQPDIVHVHDWPTALAPMLYKLEHNSTRIKFVITIHNLSHQGICSRRTVKKALTNKNIKLPIRDNNNLGKINFLYEGIFYSDIVITVSKRYAHDILSIRSNSPNLLKGFEGKTIGVVNGIDYMQWDPSSDPLIKTAHPPNNVGKTLEAKAANRDVVREKLELANTDCPLMATISRLDYQKGLDLILTIIPEIVKMGAQLIMLISGENHDKKQLFRKAHLSYKYHKHVKIVLEFNEALAHMLFSASHFLLIPSRFEPCGLTQMIAMNYGSIPIATDTGGLHDTIVDGISDKRNGYLIPEPKPDPILQTIQRALSEYGKPDYLQRLDNGLKKDWSWEKRIEEVLYIYRRK